jgi:hypothetical protein
MIDVAADMCLEHDLFLFSAHPSAIDEVPDDMSNLGDMGVGRDVVAVRQNEAWEAAGMLLQSAFQFLPIRATMSIYLYRNVVKMASGLPRLFWRSPQVRRLLP